MKISRVKDSFEDRVKNKQTLYYEKEGILYFKLEIYEENSLVELNYEILRPILLICPYFFL